jgi:putative ABC transport system permease protein
MIWTRFISLLRRIFRRNVVESELDDEMQAYLQQDIDARIARGMTADEARRNALVDFGGREQTKERVRDVRTGVWLDVAVSDFRYAMRMLRRNPGFSVIALLTLALGIGANTAIFSIVNSILIRPLPYEDPDQLVWVWGRFNLGNTASVSPPDFRDYRAQAQLFDAFGCFSAVSFTITGNGEPERLNGSIVSAEFFRIFGVKPAMGREFTSEEERVERPGVVILSHGLWQRRFGGDAGIIGRNIVLDGRPLTVVGVMPQEFRFSGSAEAWVPIPLNSPGMQSRGAHFLRPIARLKSSTSIAQAQAEVDVIADRLAMQYPDTNKSFGLRLVPLQERIVGNSRRSLTILMASVSLVLLIACVNVANLLLSRATSRQKEIAIRTALGASRVRNMRLMMNESIVLALCGGAGGVLLANWAVKAVKGLNLNFIPRASEIQMDNTVLGYTLAISLLTGILFGILPAVQASYSDFNNSLKEAGRTSSSGGRSVLRQALVTAEVALALVLSIGAGLTVKSLVNLSFVDPGFKTANLLTMRLDVFGAKYPTGEKRAIFYDAVRERIAALPGVAGAAYVSQLPLSGQNNDNFFEIEGRPVHDPGKGVTAQTRYVAAEYFKTMSIPVLRGRGFTAQEARDGAAVTLINEALARQYFTDQDPIGHRILLNEGPVRAYEIVGVVGDIRHFQLAVEPADELYVPSVRGPQANLVVRTSVEPASVVRVLREQVWAVDKDLPLSGVRTMEEIIDGSLGGGRFMMYLLGLFSIIAVALAAIGIYGVISYAVSQQIHEMGLRMALGARRLDVLSLVMRRGLILTGIGIMLGLVAAAALTKTMSEQLYQVSTTDVQTFALTSGLLFVIALLSSYIPARRATKVDPMVALRHE